MVPVTVMCGACDRHTVHASVMQAVGFPDRAIVSLQLETLAEALHTAQIQENQAKAACNELELRRRQLLDDNAACENAIGDVFQRKEV